MDIYERLKNVADLRFIDYFGVADLTQVHDRILSRGDEKFIGDFPRAISIGIKLFHDIVDKLPNRKERSVCVAYKHHCYDVINLRLDTISSELSSILQQHGYRTYPIPASKRVNDEQIRAIFSHKMAAHLSGIGWIGKSCLLITPEVGPRVRFATVLTDAPLGASGSPLKEQCGSCQKCVDVCPVNAFTGCNYSDDEPREKRYNALTCQNYFRSIQKVNDWAFCGMCVYVCPYGKNKSVHLPQSG
jgi:epoxyqueuosine reductase QueG